MPDKCSSHERCISDIARCLEQNAATTKKFDDFATWIKDGEEQRRGELTALEERMTKFMDAVEHRIDKKTTEIADEVKKTNAKLEEMDKRQNQIVGGLILLSVISPIISAVILHYLK